MDGWNEIIQGILRAVGLILSRDPEVFRITLISLTVSGSATLIASMIGIPLGVVLALGDFRGKTFLRSMINTLMGLPPVVIGLVLYLLLSAAGPFGFLRLLYTPEAMVMAQMIAVLPLSVGISISAVEGVDPKLRETAISLGASRPWQTWIMLNEARIGIITSIVVGFGAAISEVGAIMIVGGNLLGYTRALTTAIVLLTNEGAFEEAIALGIILLMLSFVVNLLLVFIQLRLKRHDINWGRWRA